MRDYALGTTFDLKFTTRRFSTGAPYTLAGTPSVAAYPDNSTTEITAGITLTTDFDTRAGVNNVRVVATSGNGYAAGSNYALVITAGTVDGVSVVGEVIGEFSLEAQSPLRPTITGRTLDVSAGGEAGLDWANVGSPTTTVGLSGTTVKTATDVETDTADIRTRLPAALVSGRIDASVGAMAANVLTASAINADAITAAKIADGAIDAATFAAGAINAAAIATDAITAAKLAADAGAEIADAVWDEAISGHLTGGSTGAALNAAGSSGDPWSTPLPGAYGVGTAGKIVGDNVNATISSRLAAASYTAPLDAAGTRGAVGLASANLDTQLAAIEGYIDTEVAAILAAVDSEVAAIKAKTDNLPAAPAAVGSAMTLTSGERDAVAAALLDLAAGVETNRTLRQALRLILAAAVGKSSGLETTTAKYRDSNDTVDRITATVDADGNRSAVTLNAS